MFSIGAWKFKAKLTSISVLSLIFLVSCTEERDDFGEGSTSERFPLVSLKGLNTEDGKISDYKGQVVLLNFWATWCAPCRREMPSLVSLKKKLNADRFAVIAMSVDEDDHIAREFLIDKKIELTSFIDIEGKNIAEPHLDILAYPYTLVINKEGEIIARIEGAREWDRQVIVDDLKRAFATGQISE